jgi:diguanylate cyclase (GGDEF)-like protein
MGTIIPNAAAASAPRRWWTVPLVAAGILALANLLLWQWAEERRRVSQEHVFQARADLLIQALNEQLNHDADALRAIRGFAQAGGTPDPGLWRDFLDSLDARSRYPGVMSFQLIPRVDAMDVADFNRRAKAQDRPLLWDMQGGRGRLLRKAESYFPVLLLEPTEPGVLSFDVSSRPGLWEQTQRPAAEQGDVRLGAPINPMEAPDVVALPLYAAFYQAGAPPETPEARKAALRGFVALLLEVNDLFKDVPDAGSLDLVVRDGGPDAPILYHRTAGKEPGPDFLHAEQLMVMGRAWTVEIRPTAWWNRLGRGESWGILGSGVAISLGLLAALAGLARARGRALALADRMTLELRETNRTLLELATTDPLTGLLNRRAMEVRATEEDSRAARENLPVAVVLLDVDFFKHVNDKYGHEMGDVVLRNLGAFLRENTRVTDHAARIGGEEFMLLLSNTDAAGALSLAEHLREGVEALQHRLGETRIKATSSFGVAVAAPGQGVPIAKLQGRADKALYKAKENGRNRVELWVPPPME